MKKTLFMMLFTAIAVCLISCSKGSGEEPIETLSKKNVSLYVGESVTLEYSGNSCVWSSDEPLIASVQNGKVTANLVGETRIRANDLYCNVTVMPQYTMYKEPCLKWYSSISNVKNEMDGYELYSSDNTSLAYIAEGNVHLYYYTFEDNQLVGSVMGVEFEDSYYLADFIVERYIPIDYDSNYFYFISLDQKTIGAIQVTTSYTAVAYMPYGVSARSIDLEKEFEQLFSKLSD